MSLENTLINSCIELNKNDILSDELLDICKQKINPNSFDNKINVNEKDIFGENRTLKIDKYDIFIKDMKKIVELLIQKYEAENNESIKKKYRKYNKRI